MASLRKYVGGVIRQLRQAAGLTQDQLGARARISGKLIGEYERGARNATLASIEQILTALGVQGDKLLKAAPNVAPAPSKNPLEERLLRAFGQIDRSLQPVAIEVVRAIQRSGRRKRR